MLRKAEPDVDSHAFGYRTLSRLQSLSDAGVLYISIRNPRVHFPALLQHVIRGRLQVSEDFGRESRIADQRRDCLDDLPVFRQFFRFCEPVSRLNQLHDFWVFGDRRWICGLPVHKTE